MSPTAAQIQSAHHDVLEQWRAILRQVSGLRLVDRLIVTRTMKARAQGLFAAEGMIPGTGPLAMEAQAVSAAAAEDDPTTTIQAWAAGIAVIVGFFGWFSKENILPVVKDLAASAGEAGHTFGAGIATGVLFVGVPTVVFVWLLRGAYMAYQAIAEWRTTPSASTTLLATAAVAEQQVFGLLGRRTPGGQVLTGGTYGWLALAVIPTVWVLGSFVVAFVSGLSDGSGPVVVPTWTPTFKFPIPTT